MYVLCNTQASSYNHCWRVEATIITYSGCVFLDLGIQHAMRMRHIVICGLPDSSIFFHILSFSLSLSLSLSLKKSTTLGEKSLNIKYVF